MGFGHIEIHHATCAMLQGEARFHFYSGDHLLHSLNEFSARRASRPTAIKNFTDCAGRVAAIRNIRATSRQSHSGKPLGGSNEVSGICSPPARLSANAFLHRASSAAPMRSHYRGQSQAHGRQSKLMVISLNQLLLHSFRCAVHILRATGVLFVHRQIVRRVELIAGYHS